MPCRAACVEVGRVEVDSSSVTGPVQDVAVRLESTPFRAALNLSFEEGLVTTDFAWRTKLKPIEGADKSRDLYLDRTQRQAFLTKAPADLGAFIRGMCQVPLRPGAVAALDVGG